MGSTAWAVALMVTLAVVIVAAFILLWVKDKDRADEESEDPERIDTGADLGADAQAGTTDEPTEPKQERRT